MSAYHTLLSDPFGHAAAAAVGMQIFEINSRQTGRTSRMLEQLQDGDRLICLTKQEARRVECMLHDMGKKGISVRVHEASIDGLLKCFGTMPNGRTFVDHEWCRAYFERQNEAARNDLARMLQAMSKTWPAARQQSDETALRQHQAYFTRKW